MMTHLHAGLSAETTEKARAELNENPESLHQDIQQVLGSARGRVRPREVVVKGVLPLVLLRSGT